MAKAGRRDATFTVTDQDADVRDQPSSDIGGTVWNPPYNNRRIALESHDTDGALLWRHELRASDLRYPRTPETKP